jgi:hypothetical protein
VLLKLKPEWLRSSELLVEDMADEKVVNEATLVLLPLFVGESTSDEEHEDDVELLLGLNVDDEEELLEMPDVEAEEDLIELSGVMNDEPVELFKLDK